MQMLPYQLLISIVFFVLLCADDITMVICPGIGNHSEKHYIRTFVDHSQKQGYRCAVLNHLGALPNIELTSPRMFTYGTAAPYETDPPVTMLHSLTCTLVHTCTTEDKFKPC